MRGKRGTELETARTPNLDRLARNSDCGLLEPVGPGITPGSGPGHLALFGYDPFQYPIGRGVLSGLGIGRDFVEGDVAARANFATLGGDGKVKDRRAGRIPTQRTRELCEKLKDHIRLDFDGNFDMEPVKDHRAVLVLRGPGLAGNLQDTDPQRTGLAPRDPAPQSEQSEKTAALIRSFLEQTRDVLSDEQDANMVLLRGFDQYRPFPSLTERFKLKGLCIAEYPMYRGVSRLLGFETREGSADPKQCFLEIGQTYDGEHDFYFIHIKATDSSGEDGDFDKKVEAIERVDRNLPDILEVEPDVLVVTGDHSTPSGMAGHSWHPVPVLIYSKFAGSGVEGFGETSCRQGSLGLRPTLHLIGLALAHAGRLEKYGA